MEADDAIKQEVLALVPQQKPFRFIDEILTLNEEEIVGAYRFREDEFFYGAISPICRLRPGSFWSNPWRRLALWLSGCICWLVREMYDPLR